MGVKSVHVCECVIILSICLCCFNFVENENTLIGGLC